VGPIQISIDEYYDGISSGGRVHLHRFQEEEEAGGADDQVTVHPHHHQRSLMVHLLKPSSHRKLLRLHI
jgi:hypothetical protein